MSTEEWRGRLLVRLWQIWIPLGQCCGCNLYLILWFVTLYPLNLYHTHLQALIRKWAPVAIVLGVVMLLFWVRKKIWWISGSNSHILSSLCCQVCGVGLVDIQLGHKTSKRASSGLTTTAGMHSFSYHKNIYELQESLRLQPNVSRLCDIGTVEPERYSIIITSFIFFGHCTKS